MRASVDGSMVFEKVEIASGYFKRLKGLLGRSEIEEGYALLFPKCSSIHCIGMRVPIDVAYMDADGVVIECETCEPWRLGANPAGACSVLECRAGYLDEIGVAAGKRISLCA